MDKNRVQNSGNTRPMCRFHTLLWRFIALFDEVNTGWIQARKTVSILFYTWHKSNENIQFNKKSLLEKQSNRLIQRVENKTYAYLSWRWRMYNCFSFYVHVVRTFEFYLCNSKIFFPLSKIIDLLIKNKTSVPAA